MASPGWRLLDSGVRSAAAHMALDDVLLAARARHSSPDTLRFLQFSPHCALVGYHQNAEQELRLPYCRERGIAINRRLTGGGALYWDENQLGWEIVASRSALGDAGTVRLPELICQGVILGLRKLGVRAEFRPRNDIEVDGRKISGTGGTSLGQAILYQGSLLVDFDVNTMLRALRIPMEKLKDKEIDSVRERVTSLSTILGAAPPLSELKTALAAGFSEALGATFTAGDLSLDETAALGARLPYYESDAWIYGARAHQYESRGLRGLHRARGGLMRVSLLLEGSPPCIREVFLTGDFFSHPRRAIRDLEARLKGVPATISAVNEAIAGFLATSGAEIPGVTTGDFSRLFGQALEKMDYLAPDIPAGEINSLYSVVRPIGDVRGSTLLLLPYCAKPPDCEYRHVDGCARCGRCSIDEGYELAARHGLQPVCITNYEALEQTLLRARAQGARAFVGCCCEAFVAKHRTDFERIGLPGILIDIDDTTCYDLGQEREARAGRFDRQTSLKTALLAAVLARPGTVAGDAG